MGQSVGQTLGRVAGEFGEGVVEFDHGAGAIGDEKPLLQRVHHGIAELVAIGEIVGAGPLFFGSLCRGIEGGEGVQQESQRLRAIEVRNLLRQLADKLGVFLDDLQHADVVMQRLAPELIAHAEVVRAARLQVGTQSGLRSGRGNRRGS